MREKIRNIAVFVLILGVLLGLVLAQSYSNEARLINHPELNCPDGWEYAENQDAQMCVKPVREGDQLMINVISNYANATSDTIFIPDNRK